MAGVKSQIAEEERALRKLLVNHFYSLDESFRKSFNSRLDLDLYSDIEKSEQLQVLLRKQGLQSLKQFLSIPGIKGRMYNELASNKKKGTRNKSPLAKSVPAPLVIGKVELEGDDEDVVEVGENMFLNWLGTRLETHSFEPLRRPVYRTGAVRGLTECVFESVVRKYGVSCLNMKDFMCGDPETVTAIVINFAKELPGQPFYVVLEKYTIPDTSRAWLRQSLITSHTLKFYEFGEGTLEFQPHNPIQTLFFAIEAIPANF